MTVSEVTRPREVAPTGPHPRLRSLDALRGLAVVGMLLVDNAGIKAAMPGQLVHAAGDGLHVADVVFPLFLFVVGASMAFSRRAASARETARRVVLLAVIGVVIVSVKWGPVGVTGVLQHIALAYALGWAITRLPVRWWAVAVAALLAGYWALMTSVAVPGVSPGWESPDNLSAHVDRVLLGKTGTEGLLPALVSAANVVVGLAAGALLRGSRVGRSAAGPLFALAAACGAAGLAVLPAVPLNKTLWTPSYALVTAALSVLLLLASYDAVDRPGARWRDAPALRPLEVLGANAIVVYVASYLGFGVLAAPVRPLLLAPVRAVAGDPAAALAWALLSVVLAWALAAQLYRRRLFLRV